MSSVHAARAGGRLGVSPIRAETADSSVVVAGRRLAWDWLTRLGASAHARAAVDCMGGGRPRPVSDRRCDLRVRHHLGVDWLLAGRPVTDASLRQSWPGNWRASWIRDVTPSFLNTLPRW
jgi:hypothetical protein